MEFKIDDSQLSEAVKTVAALDAKQFKTARISAMKATGYMIRKEMVDYIENDLGPERHPVTAKYKKKVGSMWPLRRSRTTNPAGWLAKVVRYRAAKDGSAVQVDFGKSRAGEPGTFDAELQRMARRTEEGQTVRVTDKMRRAFAAGTRRKRPKQQTPGETYFPLREST